MKRFTLKAFLIAIAAIALLLAYGMLQYRYWNLEAEVVRLRVEGGHLVPVDKSLVNIIEVPSPEPHVWRWKVYAPPGTQFEYGIRFSDIPPTGVPNPQSSGEFYIESTTNGVLVTATIASDIDDGYVLILDCKDRFSRFSRISRTNLPLSEWVDGSAEIRTAGEDNQSFSTEEG